MSEKKARSSVYYEKLAVMTTKGGQLRWAFVSLRSLKENKMMK